MQRKICVLVTARPSYSRIKTVLKAINECPELELQLVVGASALLDRYGTAENFIVDEGFEVAARVYMVLEGENPTTMAKTTGIGLMELSTVLDNLKPDVVLTVADRYETLATAVAGSYMNIPVAHVQGGEITGSIDEKVRHAVTKLSDLHFVSTQKAAKRVIRMGEDPDTVFCTGCPSIDLASEILDNPKIDFNPTDKYKGVGPGIEIIDGYIVVLQHPVTTEYHQANKHANETLKAVSDLNLPTFWFWPNVDAGSDGITSAIRRFREIEKPQNIHFFKNFTPADFLRLIYNCLCLVGNSSVGIRESSFLGAPVVNIGTRQEGRERSSNVMDVEYDRDMIKYAIKKQISNGRYSKDTLYGDGKAGKRIARVLAEVPLRIEKKLNYQD